MKSMTNLLPLCVVFCSLIALINSKCLPCQPCPCRRMPCKKYNNAYTEYECIRCPDQKFCMQLGYYCQKKFTGDPGVAKTEGLNNCQCAWKPNGGRCSENSEVKWYYNIQSEECHTFNLHKCDDENTWNTYDNKATCDKLCVDGNGKKLSTTIYDEIFAEGCQAKLDRDFPQGK